MRYLLIIFASCFFVVMQSYGLSSSVNLPPALIDSISSDCSQLVTWRLGSIDSRFEVTEADLLTIMNDVQNLWSDAVDTNLIEYSDSAEVTINLIYSEDQKFTNEEQELFEQISKMRKKYNSIKMEYQQGSEEFQRKLIQPFLEFEEQVNEYITQYNNRFRHIRNFQNAVYIDVGNQKKVNIYQFEDIDKLRLVLAHEFGHVLGLSHARNPISIMYHRMRLQNDKILKLTSEDLRAIQNKCGL